MVGSSQGWQEDKGKAVVGSSLPNPYVDVRIAVFPRSGNVSGSWRWSALTVRSHFALQMSVWGSRSDSSLILHLEFLPTSKLSSNPDTGLCDSCRKLTWKTIIFYNSSKQEKMVVWFLSCPDCLITRVSRNACIVIKLQSVSRYQGIY